MKKYELLEHTADVRIKAQSDTVKGLFEIALEALTNVLLHGSKFGGVKGGFSYDVNLESVDQTALIVEFLAEGLYLMHANNVIITGTEIESIDENSLKASIFARPVRGFSDDVKAVTYHEAEIVNKSEGIYETIIVLDI